MEYEIFFALVVHMRRLQKLYFAGRDAIILSQCREAEKAVDNAIIRLQSGQDDLL
ncbi:MAG: hypothetical protein ACRC3H_26980 [Lachnospiraceae bacterium]